MSGPAQADSLVGQQIGGVQVNRLLAKGLLSDVYLGVLDNSQTPVAVKVLSPKVMAQGMSTERFMREGRALAQLSHPNIVKIHNVGVEKNRYFIVMDFIQDGANLRTLANQHTLKPFQSLVVARRMAEALEYIHSLGFIHRDIKPANICLRSNGQPILMDFSLIKDEGSDIQLTAPGTIMGTVNFMPPEQAQPGGPFGAVTPASDVYSLGATFYWLLTGQAPFKGKTPMETIVKLIREPVLPPSKLNPSVPAELDELCLKSLAKIQSERFQTAREFIVAIDNLVARKRGELQAAQAPVATSDDNEPSRPAAAPPPVAAPPSAQWGAAAPAAASPGWGQTAAAAPAAPPPSFAPPPPAPPPPAPHPPAPPPPAPPPSFAPPPPPASPALAPSFGIPSQSPSANAGVVAADAADDLDDESEGESESEAPVAEPAPRGGKRGPARGKGAPAPQPAGGGITTKTLVLIALACLLVGAAVAGGLLLFISSKG